MTKRVYISYTNDLKNFAVAVKDAMNSIGLQGIIFDDYSKRTSNSVMAGLHNLIESCDFFIGVYAVRYGGIPSTDHKNQPTAKKHSYIHWEYQWAVEHKLEIIPLIMRYEELGKLYDDEELHHQGQHNIVNREPALVDFLDELMKKHVCGFYNYFEEDIYNLAIQFIASRLVPASANTLEIEPNFDPPSKAEQYQCDMFMVMPFRDDLDKIYQEDIKSVAEDIDKVVKRGDDFQSPTGKIMAEVWHAIYASKIVITDCTKPEMKDKDGNICKDANGNVCKDTNGNVYYELGIADVLGKPVVLITQTMPEELPFDIRHRRLIVYDLTQTGRNNLRVQLESALRTLFHEIGEPIP